MKIYFQIVKKVFFYIIFLVTCKKYINKLYAKGIDGIIIAPAAQSMNSILSLKKLEIPFVLINPQDRNNDFELLNINSYHFVYSRIKELLKSHIHKIAFLGTSVNSESFNAFVDAHRIMKIKINDDLIFMGKATFKNGYSFAEQLFFPFALVLKFGCCIHTLLLFLIFCRLI